MKLDINLHAYLTSLNVYVYTYIFLHIFTSLRNCNCSNRI